MHKLLEELSLTLAEERSGAQIAVTLEYHQRFTPALSTLKNKLHFMYHCRCS